MAENDIYNSKGKYELFKENLNKLLTPPKKRERRKYYCKNAKNLKYFDKLFARFEAKDLSYIRRIRLSRAFLIIVYCTEKELSKLEREDIDKIIAYMHSVYKSPKSKSDFMKDIKLIWRTILPEEDVKGRPDESLVPYVVRHLSPKIDKSKEKARNDKLDLNDFERLIDYFSSDIRMQCFLSLALESIGRPQELLYRRIEDVELKDNYAIINLTDHGKE